MHKARNWGAEPVLEKIREYQLPAVIMGAAELDVFTVLDPQPLQAAQLATRLKCDRRGMEILLNALAAAGLLTKSGDRYRLTGGVAEALSENRPQNVLGMVRHQANCYRRWGALAVAVKKGKPAGRTPSVRGQEDDLESFIEAMHNVSAPAAAAVIRAIKPLKFERLLDIGGASGTWSLEFLNAWPQGRAILFDLPEVIPLARRRVGRAKLSSRVELISGNYNRNRFPGGCDLAWLSAIVHQNSMPQNFDLFRRVHTALRPGGRIAIRDIVMNEDHVQPPAGAFFAVNMLAGTKAGGTFTFNEMADALKRAGFTDVRLARNDPGMHSIIIAVKPGQTPSAKGKRRPGSPSRSRVSGKGRI